MSRLISDERIASADREKRTMVYLVKKNDRCIYRENSFFHGSGWKEI
jgi:hypothetical protein